MFLEDRRKSTVALRRKPPDPNVGSHLPPPPPPRNAVPSAVPPLVEIHELSPSPPRPPTGGGVMAASASSPRPIVSTRSSWPQPGSPSERLTAALPAVAQAISAKVYVQPIPIERIFHNGGPHRFSLPELPQPSPREYYERPSVAYDPWSARVPFDGVRNRYAFS